MDAPQSVEDLTVEQVAEWLLHAPLLYHAQVQQRLLACGILMTIGIPEPAVALEPDEDEEGNG